MHTKSRTFALVASIALAAPSLPSPATAQLANASASTLGMGGNTTAIARGFGAVSVNPAGLGMARSSLSLALAPMAIRQGLGPVTLADLKEVEGTLVSAATKEEWLARVVARGRQTGSVGAEVSGFALASGRFGFQVSTLVGANMSLAPDIVEAMLYGNAGRSGTAADLTMSGSTLGAFGVTTAGVSMGLPIPSESATMALGVTLKYSVGHVLAVGSDRGGAFESDPVRVDVNFPLVTTDEDLDGLNNGSGVGVDLGFQMRQDRISLGVAVLNALSTFAWSGDKLVYRAGTALLEEGKNGTDFEKQPVAAAPDSVRRILDDMTFDPVVSVGAAYDVDPDLTVSADIRNRFGDGMSLAPKLHAGVGAEYRGIDALHLRGGAAMISRGFQVGGGASLIMGPVNLSLAGAIQRGEIEDANVAQVTLSWGGR